MKRKAILIGNTRGLQGVSIDLAKTRAFLRSAQGGAWLDNEIETFENPRRDTLLRYLRAARVDKADLGFVLFSGHGGHARRTVLELNRDGETIEDADLHDLAVRQLTIHDCCRVEAQQTMTKSFAMDAMLERAEDLGAARRRYEARILQAIAQQVRLYACKVGECSYDTPTGAIYLSHLLSAARSPGTQFTTVGDAHEVASRKTALDRKDQHPEAFLPKCLISQQLIISQH